MKHFIHNNKGILSLWLVLALFFSLMPIQAMGKEAVSDGVVSGSSQGNFDISTGPAIKVNKVTIATGSGLVYNGEEQELVTGINIELSGGNNNLTRDDITLNWRAESLEQKSLKQPCPSCPPLNEDEWENNDKFASDILPMVNAGDMALYCRAVDKSNAIIATGSAVVRIDKYPVKLIWHDKSGVSLPYNEKNYQVPEVVIGDSKTNEMFQKDNCSLETKITTFLEDIPKNISKTDSKAVGKYRVTAFLSGDKKDNYSLEGEQLSCDYTIVPKLKNQKKSADFIWGKKWEVKKHLRKFISCDDAALSKMTLSVNPKKGYIQESKNGKYINVGKKRWNKKIKSNTSILFTVKLTGIPEVSWEETLNGHIKFPGFSKVKSIVNKKRKGTKCKYIFDYNVKKASPYAKGILVKISGVKKNKGRINAVLKKFVSGSKSDKNSYLRLIFPTKKKAKKTKVIFKIQILYGKNRSKVQKVTK